jgi:hypothetical protein
MINKNKPLAFTQEEINEWEANDAAKRKITTLTYLEDEVDPEGKKYVFQVVNASRKTVHAIADMTRKGAPTQKINELTINSCVLAGPMDDLETDDALYYALLDDLANLGTLKKRL